MIALGGASFAQSAGRGPAPQSQEARVALETSETLFTVTAAMNACGYDQELQASEPVRAQVRREIAEVMEASSAAAAVRDNLCQYYRDKQLPDASRDLSQYVSFGLNLNGPPQFSFSVRESDLPPDASNIIGFLPQMQRFYDTAGIHKIWLKHQPEYEAELQRLHEPIAEMIQRTDLYLKLPSSGYLGRRFVVYSEPLASPAQVNARNFGNDYFMVVSPGNGGNAGLHLDQIRHTYLHYTLDPLMQKRAGTVKRVEPLLAAVRTAPLDESFKNDASLMIIESLIRAIEARNLPVAGDRKEVERGRSAQADLSMKQGYILTRYFYDQLEQFEKVPTSLRDAFGDMMYTLDVLAEIKRADKIVFSAQGSSEVVSTPKVRRLNELDLAEQRLGERDAVGAHRIAQKVLDERSDDPARAMFILARAATLQRNVDDARLLFERTLEIAREPRMVAWTHIYLGRILDLMCSRPQAVNHYQAALSAGDPTPDTQAAAEKGIREAPPAQTCESDKQ